MSRGPWLVRLILCVGLCATVVACSAKGPATKKPGDAPASSSDPAPTPTPEPPAPKIDVTVFVPAADAVEITGTNLAGVEAVAVLEVMGDGFTFARVGAETPYDAAIGEVSLSGSAPRAFGPTTPVRVLILDAATKAVRLCADSLVVAGAMVATRASRAGCALLDAAVTSAGGRALLPVIDLRTLAELGQTLQRGTGGRDPALLADVAASFIKERASQRVAQGTSVEHESERLAAEAARMTVAETRELVLNGKYSEIALERPSGRGVTGAVVRQVASSSAAPGAAELPLALAAIAIEIRSGTTLTPDQIAAASTDPVVLVAAVEGALSGGDASALAQISATAAAAPALTPGTPPPPPVPRDFLITPLGGGVLRLSWSAPQPSHRVVLVHRSGAAVTFSVKSGESYDGQVGVLLPDGSRIRHVGNHVPFVNHTGLDDGMQQHYALWALDPASGRYSRSAARAAGRSALP